MVCGLISWGKQWSQQLFILQQSEKDSVCIRKNRLSVNSTGHDARFLCQTWSFSYNIYKPVWQMLGVLEACKV